MSCSVCRLPFLPDEVIATSPRPEHFAPPGILSSSEKHYFQLGVATGEHIIGLYVPVKYFSANMFGGSDTPILLTMVWEFEHTNADYTKPSTTLQMTHRTCANLLRKCLDAEDDTLEAFKKFAMIEIVLGRPQGGKNSGRWKFVDYENATRASGGKAVDIEQFWRPEAGMGLNWFDWRACEQADLSWTFRRPDIFPKFFDKVDLAKLILDSASKTSDILTTLPEDVLFTLLPYLDLKAYLAFTGTCRFLRHHAQTEWQPHARRRTLALGWAVPTQTETNALKSDERKTLATPDQNGDWFRYLLHAHATKSMRVRRWIWGICNEVKSAVERRYSGSGLEDLEDGKKSPERVKLEERVAQQFQVYSMMQMTPKLKRRK